LNTVDIPSLTRHRLGTVLHDLCAVDTTPGREDLLHPVLLSFLQELGADVHLQAVDPGRTNVLATWGQPHVLFSTHLDTVAPHVSPVLEPGRVRGRGACDAKGQVVAQLGAIAQLLREGWTGLGWLGVVGEETDSAGAAKALELAPRLPGLRVLVNGEPTELKLGRGQRGVLVVRLTVAGQSAHASEPERGRSAAWLLLDWLDRLRVEPLAVDAMLGPEVWNLGLLRAGEAVNSVPAHGEAHLQARTVPGTRILEALRRTCPEGGSVEVLLDEPWDHYPELIGFDAATLPFGSDAPALRNLVPDRMVILVGPGSIREAHTLHEHITLDEVLAGVELNARLAKRFLDVDRQGAG